jgi:hypothetical protein
VIIEVAFACRAPDHEHAQPHETWPYSANKFDQFTDFCDCSDKEILIENKKWLHRANLSTRVFDCKIAVIESLKDRILNDFVIAMVLSLACESMWPMAATCQFIAPNCFNAA